MELAALSIATATLVARARRRNILIESRDVEKEFLQKVAETWSSSNNHPIVVAAGKKIANCISNIVPNSFLLPECKCTTPPLPLGSITSALWNKLPWKIPSTLSVEYKTIVGDRMKSAMCVGNSQTYGAFVESTQIYCGFMWLAPNTHYPAHAHDANEFFHILSGTAKWTQGPIDDWQEAKPGDFRIHQAGESHSVKTGDEALVALYYWYGNITGKYWFEKVVVQTEEERLKGAYNNLDNTTAYYDDLASKYDTVVVDKWGYKMPFEVAKMCASTVLNISKSARILDLGCGSGLVAVEFKKLGYNIFTGIDISKKSLTIARQRKIYLRLLEGNLSKCLVPKVLPREGMFDVLTCVGTTSYLDPEVLSHWARLVKPGGLIVLTHKTEIWKKWEPVQTKFVLDGTLEHILTSSEMLYLPGFKTACTNENERAKIYVFRRPK